MTSTYNNDLRLEEMVTGEKDGTWGDILNTQLGLIADAFSYGTLEVAADADETFTIPNGSANAARGLYIKFTSAVSLTATRTLTLGPNTVSKLWLIENATTGSQSIAIGQGSGSTVTIASGTTKMIYTDGQGSGASVVDALVSLDLASTVTATTQSQGDNSTKLATTAYVDAAAAAGTFTTVTFADLVGASGATITGFSNDTALTDASQTESVTEYAVKSYVDSVVVSIGAVSVSPTPVANDYARFTSGSNLEGRSVSEVRADLSLEVGTDVQAYDSNLTDFVTTFTLPTVDGTSGQALTTNGSGVIGFTTIDTDPTLGTLDQSFTTNQQTIITLSSAVTSGVPNVSVTKEVPQVGVTNNDWDAAASSYELEDSAYSTTLDFVGFDISNASFVDSFSVSSQETSPRGIAFNTDGTKMFIVGNTGDDVNEYILSTGFDVSTASYSQNFSVSAQDTVPTGIAFNTDGTKMFIVGQSGQDVNEYTLGTGFDVSTATYSQNFSVSAQETSPTGIAFNNDGTKMFIVGGVGQDVNEYTLGTGFDVSTASYSQNFSVSAQETSPSEIAFNTDGTKMFIVGFSGQDVNEYTLGTGFDVSTASYSQNFSVSAQETSPSGIAFNTDGTKMFIVGTVGDDVNEYTISPNLQLGTGSFASADVGKTIEANSGVFILTATDGSIVETTAPTSYSQVASGNWSMYAVVYDSSNDVLELSGVLQDAFDVSTATYSQNFSVSAQETIPRGIAFNTDGTKMFIVGGAGQDVNEYTLGTGFDVSTASYSQNFSVSAQDILPREIAFNTDGTKMFIVGDIGDDVNEYTLGTGFDVSTATYSQNFSVAAQELAPSGIAFNTDGTKMFIVGGSGQDVNEYTLGTGFDVSTASYSQNFSVSAQETAPVGIAFNTDGTKMFIVGNTGDDVNEYTLGTGFDISTASYSQNFSVSAQDSIPQGIAFNTDGTKMFIVGQSGQDVNEYTLGTLAFPSQYEVAFSPNIDTTYWTDLNSLTATNAVGDGAMYYAISDDSRTTWSVQNSSGTVRDIARNNAGTWEYNSNGTFGSETWTSATSNTEIQALRDAMGEAQNQMTSTTLNALTDAQQITLTNDLDFTAIFYLASGSTVPTYSGTAINYDANTLNEGAVIGTDYDWDFPATDKVRITSLGNYNLKVRVV